MAKEENAQIVATYSLYDSDDLGSSSCGEEGSFSDGHCSRRLSAMFEHNDLINNRIEVLTQRIRKSICDDFEFQPPRRLSSVNASPAVPAQAAEGAASSSLSAAPSSPSGVPSSTLPEAACAVSTFDAPIRDEAAAGERCRILEERVRFLERDNAELRAALSAAKAAEQPGTPAPANAEATAATSVLDKWADESQKFLSSVKVAQPAGKSSERSVGSTSFAEVDRRAARHDLLLERQRRKRLEKELLKCEGMVEQLLEEIETLTKSSASWSSYMLSPMSSATRDKAVAAANRARATVAQAVEVAGGQCDAEPPAVPPPRRQCASMAVVPPGEESRSAARVRAKARWKKAQERVHVQRGEPVGGRDIMGDLRGAIGDFFAKASSPAEADE